jgi:hypothetical protein
MAGPYDYTVNIPQPPAQNFLQSLLGIQQLKGLQQQSQLAEQQAAIQQQNAAFQQQMQPLQIEAERARINQIGQATAASAEALKGARLQNEQLRRQSDFQKELVNFTSKPVEQWSESEVRSIAARGAAINPKATEGVINFWASQPKPEKTLVDDAAMKAGIAIAQNRPDVAKSIVDQAKLDAEKLGFTTALNFLNFGGSQLDQDPALAYATILGHFGTDKTKLDQLVTASELKGKLEETQAKTKKEQAATENQLLENRIKKYEADNGVSLADIQKNKQEIFKLEAAERAHIESNPFVRKYIDSRTAFEMMKEAAPNASGDETLLTQFVKMGDPGSVVSVTEKGGVKNVTLSDYIGSLQAKLANDGSLSDAKRKELKDQAFKMLQAPQKQYKEYQSNLEPVYRKRGLDPKNIFVLPSSEQLLEDAKKQAASPAGAPGLPISTGNIPVAPTGLNPVQAEMLRRGLPLNK